MTTAGERRSGAASAELAGLRLPSVDAVLRSDAARTAIARFGRSATTGAVRERLDEARAAWQRGEAKPLSAEVAAIDAHARLELSASPSQRRVFNLTGTVLHTNLGRALLAEAALAAVQAAMSAPTTLEFDLERGERGERDDHVRGLLRRLTGAEDACVVNNNAAAVLLVLNTLAKGREVVRLARRADRDRRRVPHARHHGPGRLPAGRGRHHQPHPSSRLCRGDLAAHRAAHEGAHQQLRHRRLHRVRPGAASSRRWRASTACRWSRTWAAER